MRSALSDICQCRLVSQGPTWAPPCWTFRATEDPPCPSPGLGKMQPLDLYNLNCCGCVSVFLGGPACSPLPCPVLHYSIFLHRLATMVPLGPLHGACRTLLISLLLGCCLLPPGKATQVGRAVLGDG